MQKFTNVMYHEDGTYVTQWDHPFSSPFAQSTLRRFGEPA